MKQGYYVGHWEIKGLWILCRDPNHEEGKFLQAPEAYETAWKFQTYHDAWQVAKTLRDGIVLEVV